jgi:HlyD family secretion protein
MHQQKIDPEVAVRLALSHGTGRRPLWRWLAALALIGVVAAAGVYGWRVGMADPSAFQTQAARVGDLVVTVTSTGTLQPTNQVEVGSEISGRIAEISADYNDVVEAGQALATLDTDQLSAQVRKSKAALQAAAAGVAEAEATVAETKAKLVRVRALARGAYSSQQDVDVAEAAAARAAAALSSAQAQVEVASAALEADQTLLAKAVIRSPIDGVVIARNVEAGQTVAASFQTPVLFTLAQDLAQMELHLDIDESDIGQIAEGQEASFTVGAYPDRRFAATITSVRNAPRTVQGVVTYEAILAIDNAGLVLRPGMTATASIVTARRNAVLLVPNGALRFTPPDAEAPAPASVGTRIVWTLRDGAPAAVPMTAGLSDGLWTEVAQGDIASGAALLVDLARRRP